HLRGLELHEKYELPYYNVAEFVFQGVSALLDEQVAPARRVLAVERLKRYAGQASAVGPLSELAEARTREKLANPRLLGPARAQVEKDLANAGFFTAGIGELLKKYQIKGADRAYAALKAQLADYHAF